MPGQVTEMLSNKTITLYHKENSRYKKFVYHDVYWSKSELKTARPNDVKNSYTVTVFLYDDFCVPEGDDIIVEGLCPYELSADVESEEFAAEWKKFNKECKHYVVKDVLDAFYGGLPHYEVGCV